MALHRFLLLTISLTLVAGCTGASEPVDDTAYHPDFTAERCLVRLHGRSETGTPPVVRSTYAELSPAGNEAFGSGRQWRYDSEDAADRAREVLTAMVDAAHCRVVVINGFSNGAAFAGYLYCRGEDLDGRLVGVVVDDPVPDQGTEGCTPAPQVQVALYWTGALTEAGPGVRCDTLGWTCRGDELVGIDTYATRIGAPVSQSPHDEHIWFRDAPELGEWLAAADDTRPDGP